MRFADNQKISKRQIRRLLIYDLFGISTLILPPGLARVSGNTGLLCMVVAAALAIGVLSLIQMCQSARWKLPTDSIDQFLSKLGLLLMFLVFIGIAGYTVAVFVDVMHTYLLKGESLVVLAATILVLAGYGIVQGIEGRARVYEMLFLFLLIPLLVMLLLAVRDINPVYYQRSMSTSPGGFVWGTLLCFVSFLLIIFAGFLTAYEKEKGDAVAGAKQAVLVILVLNLIIYAILIGVFGRTSLGTMEYPILVLLSMVKLPGGFLKRQDALMVAVWFFTLYALINSGVFYGKEMLSRLIGKKGNKRYILVTLVLVCVIASFACTLTACSSTELEEREFPLAVGLDEVDERMQVTLGFEKMSQKADDKEKDTEKKEEKTGGEGWAEAFASSNTEYPKTMDYNHVKAIIVSQTILDDEVKLEKLMSYLDEKEVFARNTLLFTCEGTTSELMGIEQELDSPLGTYLEQMMESDAKNQSQKLVTLGNLENEFYNHYEDVHIPVVRVESQKPVVDSYYTFLAQAD